MKKRKTILLLSPHPGFGGASMANLNIADMLSQKYTVIYADEYLPNNIDTEYSFEIDRTKLHANFLKYFFLFTKIVFKKNVDLILIGMPIFSIYYFFPLLLCNFCGVSVGFIFHSLSLKQNLKGRIIDRLISFVSLLVSKYLFFVSEYTRESWSKKRCIRLQRKKHYVIHNVIKTVNKTNASLNIRKIAFVARMSPEKRPQLFCEVAKFSKQLNLPYVFIAYGNGELYQCLQQKYSECVLFKGYESDIELIYKDVDLLLLTSTFENCPMTILEAKMRGIPCIAPDVGGISEIVVDGEDGLLLKQFSVDKIIDSICYIDRKYKYFVDNCSHNRHLFSYDVIRKQWESIIN